MTVATHAPFPPTTPATDRALPARALRGLVAPRTWRETAHLLGDLPVGIVTFTVILPFLVTSAALVPVFPAAVLGAWLVVALSRLLARLERLRAWILLDVDMPDEELAAREPAPAAVRAFAAPRRGWERLYVDTVGQANTGADLDFLVGSSGDAVSRESH